MEEKKTSAHENFVTWFIAAVFIMLFIKIMFL